jgi:catechol 2,3-dioxygenase-like lactoylglutathione lyase family enzyme
MRKTTPLAVISVLVDDQDEALQFYTEKLGLEKRCDVAYGPGLRWLTVAPRGQQRPEIALAVPDAALEHLQREHVARRYPARDSQGVSGIFDTSDCARMYVTLLARGVKFISPPTRFFYGTEAVFEDPYGNKFSLLEPSPEAFSRFEGAGVGTAA